MIAGIANRRDVLKGAAAVIGAASLMSRGAVAQTTGQTTGPTVFTGGTILTVDEDFSEAEAIAITGNTIVAVGTEADVRAAAGQGAAVVDLGGRTMLPGFCEAHTHPISGAIVDATMEYIGMARFRTTDEVLARIAERAAETPAGEWMVFRNFDPAVQEGVDELTFADFDAITTEHPIFVLNASGHLGYANRMAMNAAGIGEDAEDPEGAEYVRDADGKLTGVIKNQVAFVPVVMAYPAFSEADPIDAFIGLLDKWSEQGVTTCSDLGHGALTQSPADFQIMMAAASTGRLKSRIRAYPFYSMGAETWDAAGISMGDGNPIARIAGYKLVADGSNQGFTGLQREPYVGTDSRGLAYMDLDWLTGEVIDRASKGWHIAIHGNGDAGIDNILDAFEAARDAGIDLSDARPRIEHCSILHDDQIQRMRDLGVGASFLIGHVYYWGQFMRDEVFGEDKAQLLDRAKSAEDAGIGFTLHSDFMVTDPVPLHMIEMAVTRRLWKEPDYVLAPQERISVETAIRAMTINAAYQMNSETEVGSLEVGKLADFVILDTDPRSVDPDRIKDIRVLETWMDGQQVYSA
ncbi:amidohydrolase [Phaeobacter sp. B1627]|uniref:amidohydrolase n=1 Tax=Phaeobacter sp. B1627 TaxID=2583809 RepID=UPI002106CCDE|nr:amidohydrolase [Phaeobacter sp. B1627]